MSGGQQSATSPTDLKKQSGNWGSSTRIRSPLIQRRTGLTPQPAASSSPAASLSPQNIMRSVVLDDIPTVSSPMLDRSTTPNNSKQQQQQQQQKRQSVRRGGGGGGGGGGGRVSRETVQLSSPHHDSIRRGGNDDDDDDQSGVAAGPSASPAAAARAMDTDHILLMGNASYLQDSLAEATQSLMGTRGGGGGRGRATSPTNNSVSRGGVSSSSSASAAALLTRQASVKNERSRRADAYQWGADAPREWTESLKASNAQHVSGSGGVGSGGVNQKQQQPSTTHVAPWIPENVSSTFFWMKRELAAAKAAARVTSSSSASSSSSSSPACETAHIAFSALEQLAGVSPVMKPVIDLVIESLSSELSSVKSRLASLLTRDSQSAILQDKLDQQTREHYSEVLTERQRAADTHAVADALRKKFEHDEKEWSTKLLDAQADVRAMQLELKDLHAEIADLREDRNALMSVRRTQEAHVAEVQARAEKVIRDSEREVAVIGEQLHDKIHRIDKLTVDMEGQRLLAKKELDDYASKALPPVKSAALRAEADRYKKEVAKLKEKIEKLHNELLRRESFEPAVQWEEFVDEGTLIQMCQATGVPMKVRRNDNDSMIAAAADDDDDDEDEEDEEEAAKLAGRSKDFAMRIFAMWQATLETVNRYNAERELFDRMTQVMFDVGLPMDLLPLHGAPLVVGQDAITDATTRLQLDSPPIDSSSPDPWIDPAWNGCYVQPPPTLPTESDVPIVAKAEHCFRIVSVVVPPCLMNLSQIRALCACALVLLGLNRVPDRNEAWHPARHFAHAVRIQLDAVVQQIKILSTVAAPHPSSAAGASGASGANYHHHNSSESHVKRRYFSLPDDVDFKSTTAACMTIFYHRLTQYASADSFIDLCLSFFLGTRPVLLHARYMALSLRGATQFFSRVEKMWRGSNTGVLPKPLLVHALRPAFNVKRPSDLSRLTISTFHTHYWMQMQAIRQNQVDHLTSEQEPDPDDVIATMEKNLKKATDSTPNIDAALKKEKEKQALKAAMKQQQQKDATAAATTATATSASATTPAGPLLDDSPAAQVIHSWLDTAEISYKNLFGSLRAGDASPLLLQYCAIYASDVFFCEALLREMLMTHAKKAMVSKWAYTDVQNAVESWMANNDNGGDYSDLSRWQRQLDRGFVPEQAASGVEEILLGASTSNKKSDHQTKGNDDGGGGGGGGDGEASLAATTAAAAAGGTKGGGGGGVASSTNQEQVSRVVSFLGAGMFDPSDAPKFEQVMLHLPTRSACGFEDTLPALDGPEPKPTGAVAPPTLLVQQLIESGEAISMKELTRNVLQSHPWHPKLLTQVATASWFVVDPIAPDSAPIAGCQEMSNEQVSLLAKAASGPDVGKPSRKRGGRK